MHKLSLWILLGCLMTAGIWPDSPHQAQKDAECEAMYREQERNTRLMNGALTDGLTFLNKHTVDALHTARVRRAELKFGTFYRGCNDWIEE